MAWESPEVKHEGECLTCWTRKRVQQFFPSFKQFEDSNHPRDSASHVTCTSSLGLGSPQCLRKNMRETLPSGALHGVRPSTASCPPSLGKRGQRRENLQPQVSPLSKQNLSPKPQETREMTTKETGYQMISGPPGIVPTSMTTKSDARDASSSTQHSSNTLRTDSPRVMRTGCSMILKEPAYLVTGERDPNLCALALRQSTGSPKEHMMVVLPLHLTR